MLQKLCLGLVYCCVAVGQLQAFDAANWQATGQRGVIVAGGQGAVEAGMAIFSAGGNAMDAAVATILAQSVTDSSAFCFGGEVPLLVYDARRQLVEVISGQGMRRDLLRVSISQVVAGSLARVSRRRRCPRLSTHA